MDLPKWICFHSHEADISRKCIMYTALSKFNCTRFSKIIPLISKILKYCPGSKIASKGCKFNRGTVNFCWKDCFTYRVTVTNFLFAFVINPILVAYFDVLHRHANLVLKMFLNIAVFNSSFLQILHCLNTSLKYSMLFNMSFM